MNSPTIEVIREHGKLKKFKAVLPVWTSQGNCGNTMVNIPFLGISTQSSPGHQDIAVKEAIECFCRLSETVGKGIITELQMIGWILEEDSVDVSLLSKKCQDFVTEQVLKTGSQTALEFAY